MRLFYSLSILLLAPTCVGGQKSECKERQYDQDSFVCVCNGETCDEVQPIGNTVRTNIAAIYSTGRDKDRLTKSVEVIGKHTAGYARGRILPNNKYQKIVGFGGAITDAVMIVLDKLRKGQRGDCLICKQLQNQYYGDTGISYTLGRVNMGSCDFSDREWSYAETDQDFELESFQLSQYEYNKPNFLKEAIQASNGQLKLFASPYAPNPANKYLTFILRWSAPGWMKASGHMKGGGKLIGSDNGIYYLTYARYFLRFFEEYHKKGVDFWGLTLLNEPGAGEDPKYGWQSMLLTPDQQRDFVRTRLGPLLKNHWLTKDLKIMAHDDQRDLLFDSSKKIYKDKDTYIDGLAVHWYSQSPFDTLKQTHDSRPDKFILPTEACNGYLPDEHIPLLGSWYYAERYAQDIINTLLNYGVGWTDWNIWLNEFGGPNWITGGEFYKQPMYYILGHFSKFIVPDSERIQIKIDGYEGRDTDDLQGVAFDSPQNYYVVVLHNRHALSPHHVSLGIGERPSKYVNIKLEPKTIKTVIMSKT